MEFDLFVIGGGSAGVRCGRIAAGYGARVGVAEARFWGGTCVNVGCVPKKLLVQAAEYGAWADDAAGFGWDIKKGPHDWAKLIAAKDREIGRLNGIYRKLLQGAGATIFFVTPRTRVSSILTWESSLTRCSIFASWPLVAGAVSTSCPLAGSTAAVGASAGAGAGVTGGGFGPRCAKADVPASASRVAKTRGEARRAVMASF